MGVIERFSESPGASECSWEPRLGVSGDLLRFVGRDTPLHAAGYGQL